MRLAKLSFGTKGTTRLHGKARSFELFLLFQLFHLFQNLTLPTHARCSRYPREILKHQITIQFEALGGLIVSKEASPIVMLPVSNNLNMNTLIVVEFMNSHIKFYDKHHRLLGPTWDSFLASYFDIDIDNIRSGNVNKSRLYEEVLLSPLRINVYGFLFNESVDHEQTICPLDFKNAYQG